MNNKLAVNKPIVLKTKVNNSVYHYKTEFSIYLGSVTLDLVANIKLKTAQKKNLISFEDSLLTRIMGLSDLCCEAHRLTCLADSVNPELVALGLNKISLEDSLEIKHKVENEISYFIIDLLQKLNTK